MGKKLPSSEGAEMKIQLIHPPHPTATDDKLDAPLGLLYLASSIKAYTDHQVIVTDLSGCGFDRDKWDIREADLYGITSYVCTMDLSAQIARICKEKNPDCRIIGGGANLTGLVESGRHEFIPKEYDSIVVGDGELAILEVIEDFPNLEVFYNYPLSKDLDTYPNPDYSLVDIKSYHRRIAGDQSVTILTSRGCPFRCAFCGLPNQRRTVRYRSPEAVAEEIEQIKNKYGITSFNFQDDTFLVDKKRVHRLMDLLRPMHITFRCLGRVGLDTKDDYIRLQDSGCKQIAWGIESGSQFILDRMNKKVTVAQNKEVIKWTQDLGLLDRIFILVGFPGENWETLEETKRFLEDVNPSQSLASTFQPYIGTDVCREPTKYGITKIYRDFSQYIQVNGDGLGGQCNIDTIWMKREEMMNAQAEFRRWLSAFPMRGDLLDYEKIIEEKKKIRSQQCRSDGL